MLTNSCHVQYSRKILIYGAVPILTCLQLSYLLTQLIYARTKSLHKGLFLFCKAWNMPVFFSICFYQIHINVTNNCVVITKILMMGVKLMAGVKKLSKNRGIKKYMKSKGQCKDKRHKKKYIFLRNNDCETYTFILTCCRLALIYWPYFIIMLTIRSVILKSILH